MSGNYLSLPECTQLKFVGQAGREIPKNVPGATQLPSVGRSATPLERFGDFAWPLVQ